MMKKLLTLGLLAGVLMAGGHDRRCDVNGVVLVLSCPPIELPDYNPSNGKPWRNHPSQVPEPTPGLFLGVVLAGMLVGNALWARRGR